MLSFNGLTQQSNIELVHSDLLTNAKVFDNAIKVTGNVHFKHENRNLFCDSAYFHQTDNWIRAYGNVHLNQADTLNLFCDSAMQPWLSNWDFYKGSSSMFKRCVYGKDAHEYTLEYLD